MSKNGAVRTCGSQLDDFLDFLLFFRLFADELAFFLADFFLADFLAVLRGGIIVGKVC